MATRAQLMYLVEKGVLELRVLESGTRRYRLTEKGQSLSDDDLVAIDHDAANPDNWPDKYGLGA